MLIMYRILWQGILDVLAKNTDVGDLDLSSPQPATAAKKASMAVETATAVDTPISQSDMFRSYPQPPSEVSSAVVDPSNFMSLPSSVVVDPSNNISLPPSAVVNPAKIMIQPPSTFVGPSKNMVQSSAAVLDPSKNMVLSSAAVQDPSKNMGQSSAAVLDPSKNMVQPSSSIPDHSKTKFQPSAAADAETDRDMFEPSENSAAVVSNSRDSKESERTKFSQNSNRFFFEKQHRNFSLMFLEQKQIYRKKALCSVIAEYRYIFKNSQYSNRFFFEWQQRIFSRRFLE